ncbi:nucleotidyltransferase family protein [Cytophagaceae bacterium ABcell3]|nr:nucleotidyltransferase family protein [Cytophagaceae bacterium ABcell3]
MVSNPDLYIIDINSTAKNGLEKLNTISKQGAALFVVDQDRKVVGTLSDGDIRRGLLKGLSIDDGVALFANTDYCYLEEGSFNKGDIKKLRDYDIKLAPVVSDDKKLLYIINTYTQRGVLPATALIMAGGKGERLRPLTNEVPKPMLKVGDKPILEHNINRLKAYGVSTFYISVRYLKEQIIDYFGDGSSMGVDIHYLEECEPLGTIGAAGLIDNILDDYLLVMNADILTNVDFEHLYDKLIEHGADMLVGSVPYKVSVPFAVLSLNGALVKGLEEKPTYTYYTNSGIYLLRKHLLEYVPKNSLCNATDIMEKVVEHKMKLVAEPVIGYWLDIGRMEDYQKAQEDWKYIQF